VTKIALIVASTRQRRFADKPARWLYDLLARRPGIEADYLDLKDYPMPFYDEPVSPGMKKEPFKNEVVQRWTQKVAENDGFIIVTPEYNHSFPAVLKNAIDYVYPEWNKKAIGFASYGGVGGARAIEQLRQVAVELQMAPIRQSVHLPLETYLALLNAEEEEGPERLRASEGFANVFLDQLIWWTNALKAAREADAATSKAA
jgi:NAD(P)H-dependent FMN reductase